MDKRLKTSAMALSLALVGAFVFEATPMIAEAQDAGADAATGSDRRLPTITVNARKRAESLQDAPVIITAFNTEALEQRRIQSIDELASFTPGLLVSETTTSVGGTLALRGIGNGTGSFTVDPSVSINVDGMQVASLNVRKLGQIDLEQIEVLRGPQALFFGKNSPGGVLSLKTKGPTDTFEAVAALGYEFESTDKYIEGIVSGPISDTVGGRLVARFTDMDGYFDLKTVDAPGNPLVIPARVDKYPQGDDTFVRGTLTFAPSDRLSATAKLSYGNIETVGGSATAQQRILCPLGTPQGFQPDFPCERGGRDVYLGGAPASIIALSAGAFGSDGLGLRDNTQYLGTVEVDYNLSPGLSLTSVTGYYDFDERNFQNTSAGPAATILVPSATYNVEQKTQELRLTSDFDSKLNFMLGGFAEWRDTSSGLDAVITLFPIAFPPQLYMESQSAQSVFAQLQYELNDQWEVSGGLRYSQEEKESEFMYANVDVTSALSNTQDSWSNVSPEFTLTYQPSKGSLLFASYKEGFKSGGVEAPSGTAALLSAAPGSVANGFDEENVKGFEVGGKWLMLEDTLSLNVAAYSYEYTDLQVAGPEGDSVENLVFRVRNAAGATSEGVEVDFTWAAPPEGLTLRGAVAYNDAKYDSFITQCYTGQSIAAGCDQLPNTGGVFVGQSLAGRTLNNAPQWTGFLDASYEGQVSENLGFVVTLGATYSDEFNANQRQAPWSIQEEYTKVNASFRLFSEATGWELSLVGRNLNDEVTYNSIFTDPLTGFGQGTDVVGPPDVVAFPSKGREVFLRLSHRWGS